MYLYNLHGQSDPKMQLSESKRVIQLYGNVVQLRLRTSVVPKNGATERGGKTTLISLSKT